jgi:hypothetical protein
LRSAFGHDAGRSALAEAQVTPAVKNSIDQMVGYRMLLTYRLMALLALPRAPYHSGHLFHYCGHTYVFKLVRFPSLTIATDTRATINCPGPSNAGGGREFHSYSIGSRLSLLDSARNGSPFR